MNVGKIKKVEVIKGHYLKATDVKCKHSKTICFYCENPDCKYGVRDDESAKKAQKKYRETHAEQNRERKRKWREKKKQEREASKIE